MHVALLAGFSVAFSSLSIIQTPIYFEITGDNRRALCMPLLPA
jgi:hypothetical protein